MNYQNEFEALIKKIKIKRKLIIALTVIALALTFIVCSSAQIVIMDKVIFAHKGISPVVTVLLVIFILICEMVAHALALAPMAASLNVECDPKKHLALNSAFNRQVNLPSVCAIDYFYLGDFSVALNYANQLAANTKASVKLTGEFYKARCGFFMGDNELLKTSAEQYAADVANMNKMGKRSKTAYNKMQNAINLMLAISENSSEKIEQYRNIAEPWNDSKATRGFVNYIKGVAAHCVNDKNECVYRLMSVKENCSKTFLANMAEEYISKD